MTVEEFETRLPDTKKGLVIQEIRIEDGHVRAAIGTPVIRDVDMDGIILWDREGKAYIALQSTTDDRILVVPKMGPGLRIFRGRLYFRYEDLDVRDM